MHIQVTFSEDWFAQSVGLPRSASGNVALKIKVSRIIASFLWLQLPMDEKANCVVHMEETRNYCFRYAAVETMSKGETACPVSGRNQLLLPIYILNQTTQRISTNLEMMPFWLVLRRAVHFKF